MSGVYVKTYNVNGVNTLHFDGEPLNWMDGWMLYYAVILDGCHTFVVYGIKPYNYIMAIIILVDNLVAAIINMTS